MRLADLHPQWLVKDGVRVGFVFRSPKDRKWYQSCFQAPTPGHREQFKLFAATFGLASYEEAMGHMQCCDPKASWTITPDLQTATWETISVQPSLDGSRGGLWHGFITAGQIVGGI